MNSQLQKILQGIATLADSNKTLDPVKARQMVAQMRTKFNSFDKKTMLNVQPQVVEFVLNVSKLHSNSCVTVATAGLIHFFFTNGGDSSRLQAEFFEPALAFVTSQKASNTHKQVYIDLLGKTFKVLWTRCPSPPTKEIFEAFQKIFKSNDTSLKTVAYRSLRDVLKSNPSNLFQIQADVAKFLLKAAKEEKQPEVKLQIVACLRVLAEHTFNFSALHASYDPYFQAILKGLEEVGEMQRQFVKTGAALFSLRLQESSQQNDIQTSFRDYNQRQREIAIVTKKKSPNMLEAPRTLAEIVALFVSLVLRETTGDLTPTQAHFRTGLFKMLALIFEKNAEHLDAINTEQLLNPLLLTISSAKDGIAESVKQTEIVVWVLMHCVEIMEIQKREKLLTDIIQSLEDKQLLLKAETLQSVQSHMTKNQKLSTRFHEGHQVALLKVLSATLDGLQTKNVTDLLKSPRHALDVLSPFMSEKSEDVKLYTCEVIKILAKRAPDWIINLMSLLLSNVSIVNADIMAFSTDEKSQDELSQLRETIYFYSLALASLLKDAQTLLGGVPNTMALTAFMVAKEFIKGNQQLPKQEAGWVIMEGLMHSGKALNEWVEPRMADLKKLFDSTFKIALKTEPQAVQYFRHKRCALSCLRALLLRSVQENPQTEKRPANQRLLKMVVSYIHQVVALIFSDKATVLKTSYPADYVQCQADVLECLNHVPTYLFEAKFTTLLQPVCDIIMTEDGGLLYSRIPQVYKALMNRVDTSVISPSEFEVQTKQKGSQIISQQVQKRRDIPLIKGDLLEKRLFLLEAALQPSKQSVTNLLRFKKPVALSAMWQGWKEGAHTSSQQQLVNNAILCFGKIASSKYLVTRNRLQLLKHFFIHSQPSQVKVATAKDEKQPTKEQMLAKQFRPEKIQKMARILLSVLAALKTTTENQASKHIVTFGQDELQSLMKILENGERPDNEFLGLIVAECQSYLHISTLLGDSTATEAVLENLEVELSGTSLVKKRNSLAVCALLVRQLDQEVFFNQACLARITNLGVKALADQRIKVFASHFASEIGAALKDQKAQEFYLKEVFMSTFNYAFSTNPEEPYSDVIFSALVSIAKSFCLLQGGQLEPIARNMMQLLVSDICEYAVKAKRRPGDCRIKVLDAPKSYFYESGKSQTLLLAGLSVLSVILSGAPLSSEVNLFEDQNSSQQFSMPYTSEEVIRSLLERLQQKYLSCKAKLQVAQILEDVLQRDMLSLVQKVCDGKFVNVVLNELDILQGNTDLTQTLGRVLQTSRRAEGIDSHIEFAKFVLTYKHSPQFGAEKDKTAFYYHGNFSGSTKYFVLQNVTTFLAKDATASVFVEDAETSDIRKNVSQLISLSFALVQEEDPQLQRIGFELIVSAIAKLQYSVEKIGDDEEEDDEKFALSLRQLESQGKHQAAESLKETKKKRSQARLFAKNPLLLEPFEAQIFSVIRNGLNSQSTTSRVFELIELFFTVPICRDEGTINKVVDLLMLGMNKERRFQDGGMVPALPNINDDSGVLEEKIVDNHFQKLYLLAKLLNESFSSGQKMHEHYPLKFNSEDKERLQVVITSGTRKQTLIKQFRAALSDIMLCDLGPNGNAKLLSFVIPNGDQVHCDALPVDRSLLSVCKSEFLAALSKSLLIQGSDPVIEAALFLNLTKVPEVETIAEFVAFVEEKAKYLDLLSVYWEVTDCLQSPEQVRDICKVLLSLPQLNVAELTTRMVELLRCLLKKKYFHHTSLQADFGWKILQELLKVVRGSGNNANLTFLCCEALLEFGRTADSSQVATIGKFFVVDVVTHLDQLEEPLQQLFQDILIRFTTSFVTIDTEPLVSAVYRILGQRGVVPGTIVTDVLATLFATVTTEDIQRSAAMELICLYSWDSGQNAEAFVAFAMKVLSTCPKLSKHLVLTLGAVSLKQSFVLLQEKSEVLIDVIQVATNLYPLLLVKMQFLDVFLPLIFGCVVERSFQPQSRQKVLKNLVQVVKADSQAFREFQQGPRPLNPTELQLVQKVLSEVAVQPNSTAEAAMPAGKTQPLASAGGNKIKLGFNFKKP